MAITLALLLLLLLLISLVSVVVSLSSSVPTAASRPKAELKEQGEVEELEELEEERKQRKHRKHRGRVEQGEQGGGLPATPKPWPKPEAQDDSSCLNDPKLGDGVCDASFNNQLCKFDKGDCCEGSCKTGLYLYI